MTTPLACDSIALWVENVQNGRMKFQCINKSLRMKEVRKQTNRWVHWNGCAKESVKVCNAISKGSSGPEFYAKRWFETISTHCAFICLSDSLRLKTYLFSINPLMWMGLFCLSHFPFPYYPPVQPSICISWVRHCCCWHRNKSFTKKRHSVYRLPHITYIVLGPWPVWYWKPDGRVLETDYSRSNGFQEIMLSSTYPK